MAGIEVTEVKSHTCHCVLKAMGKLLAPPPQTAVVSHAFPSHVAAVHTKVGDWVEKQQALVTLESQEVGVVKSEFYKSLADLELATLTLSREKRLLDEGIGIKKNHLAAETAHKIAQSNAEAAEKKLHVLGFTEEQVKEMAKTHQISPSITLYSPIAGKVISIAPVLGARIDETTEILKIIDTTVLWVDAEIYEKDIAKVKIGQKVDIVVSAYPDAVFQGTLSFIGDIVNPETRTITVHAEVANKDQRLKPGMFANVTIHLNGGCQSLAVPVDAILEEGDHRFVFIQEDSHFVRREVETGSIEGTLQQITKGLKSGEVVVVQGNHLLRSKLLEDILHRSLHTN
ncbi:MAG: efflux RND transporter periplasmic adaptor subunit [Pirellulales bacterium]|nr:efflux RND transporter periplasmic adaptor subunit [Pirellulales bacterium]